MIFLITFVIPYWVFGSAMESFNEWKEARKKNKLKVK
jgi:hypothetical protein